MNRCKCYEAEPHSPTLTSLHLRHSSFSNPSAASPTSQLILQPFRCFTYAIGTSPTSQHILQHFCLFTYSISQLILQPFRCFTYVIGTSNYVTDHSPTLLPLYLATAHSKTLPPLHLRYRSFYNPSVASPTSQALHVLHLASRPCIGG